MAALGGTYGGVAVLDAEDGRGAGARRARLLGPAAARARPSRSSPRPRRSTPGSSSPRDEFPVETSNSEIGREIPNAHDELCGGTLRARPSPTRATPSSPRSAPSSGGEKLVETAELFGFNAPPTALRPADDRDRRPARRARSRTDLSGERRDRRVGDRPGPGAGDAAGDGDGRADDRQRRRPPADLDRPRPTGSQPTGEPVEVTSPETAATMHRADDRRGQRRHRRRRRRCPGSRSPARPAPPSSARAALEPGQELGPGEEPPQNIDAWFTAFAPAQQARDRGRGDGRQRRRRRRHGRGADRAPGHGRLLRRRRSAAPTREADRGADHDQGRAGDRDRPRPPSPPARRARRSRTRRPRARRPAPISIHQPPPRRLRSGSVSQAPATITARADDPRPGREQAEHHDRGGGAR